MQQFMYYIGQIIGQLINLVVAIAKHFKGYFVIFVVFLGVCIYLRDLGFLSTEQMTFLFAPLIWWIFFEMKTRQHTHERMFNPTLRYGQHLLMNTKIFWKGD